MLNFYLAINTCSFLRLSFFAVQHWIVHFQQVAVVSSTDCCLCQIYISNNDGMGYICSIIRKHYYKCNNIITWCGTPRGLKQSNESIGYSFGAVVFGLLSQRE